MSRGGKPISVVTAAMVAMVMILPPAAPAAGGSARPVDGSLDPSFGSGGLVTTDFGGDFGEIANGMAIQPDGRIVAVGTASRVVGNQPDNDFAVARYEPDGELDRSFGSGGLVTSGFGDLSQDYGETVAVQPDGKVLVAGSTSSSGAVLVRYDRDGSLDTTFGSAGRVSISFVSYPNAMALLPRGQVLVAGTGAGGLALVRYDGDGTLDTSFGSGRGAVATFAGSATGEALAVQRDGRLVVAGVLDTGADYDFALARFTHDGTLDAGFGTGGTVTTDFAGAADGANAVVADASGRVTAAGYAVVGQNLAFGLARYNRDGTLDERFGTGGRATTDFGAGYDQANALVAQADGKLVAAGVSSATGESAFGLARYNRDGTLDGRFGTGGRVTTDVGIGYATAVARQGGGKLVAAGVTSPGPGISNGDFALARYRISARPRGSGGA
jgi:uncharacterized delta-60 repeat protein